MPAWRSVKDALWLAACLLVAAVELVFFTWGSGVAAQFGALIAAPTLLLGPPQFAAHCLLFFFRRRPGDGRLLTNIPLFMTGWALGAGLGAAAVAAGSLAERGQPRGTVVLAVLAAGLAAGLVWVWKRCRYLLAGEDLGHDAHPLARPLLEHLALIGLPAIGISFLVLGPAILTILVAHRWFELWAGPLAFFLALAAAMPLFAGFGMLRRGLWMLAVRRATANLATSTARGAAAGPVELNGTAVGAGAVALDAAFELDDGTGRVRVAVPAGLVAGSDERLWLEAGTGARRAHETSAAAGTRLTVIGEFVPPGTVRPWKPPFGRFLSSVVDRFVDETLQADADRNWNQLGFGCPTELFLVTDLDELRAKAVLLSAWGRFCALGTALVLAGAYLFLRAAVIWGTRG